MKKILLFICIFLTSVFSNAYASGIITHMFIAHETIAQIPDTQLRNLLLDNLDAYLVGAVYPDSGYIEGAHYGEDSHWDPFIYAFADYLKEKYINPTVQNPKLTAFLFGCAAHRISDEIAHGTFYDVIKEKDFKGDRDSAHAYGDTGIDLLLNIDKSQWFKEPSTWWVPVNDLLAVYHLMGKDQYTSKEIIWGNSVLAVASYGERIISAPAYPILKWKMPWTAANYYNWPEGGLLMNEQQVAAYQTTLWQYLQDKNKTAKTMLTITPALHTEPTPAITPIIHFAKNVLDSGAMSVTATSNADGSIDLQHPAIDRIVKLRVLLAKFIAKLSH